MVILMQYCSFYVFLCGIPVFGFPLRPPQGSNSPRTDIGAGEEYTVDDDKHYLLAKKQSIPRVAASSGE